MKFFGCSAAAFVLLALSSTMSFAFESDKWTSIVPEGAMGQSIASYVGGSGRNYFTLVLLCHGEGDWLHAVVSSLNVDAQFPDTTVSPRYLRIDGQNFQLPPEDPLAYRKPAWDGQADLLAAITSGAEITALVAPDDNLSEAIVIGTVPGALKPKELAHVLADCGAGPTPDDPVQTIKPITPDPVVGAWFLRPRGENFDTPMAKNIGKHGTSFSLYCHRNIPAAASFGIGYPSAAWPLATVELSIGDQNFLFNARAYKDHFIFAVSQSFLNAIRSGSELRETNNDDPKRVLSLVGIESALSHAYEGCGAAR